MKIGIIGSEHTTIQQLLYIIEENIDCEVIIYLDFFKQSKKKYNKSNKYNGIEKKTDNAFFYKGKEIISFHFNEEKILNQNFNAIILLQLSEKSRIVNNLLKKSHRIVDCTRNKYFENPLFVVPEINGKDIDPTTKYVKNPSSAAIQLSLVLNNLKTEFGIKSVRATSFEALLEAGEKALNDYKEQIQAEANQKPLIANYFNFPILGNIIPYTENIENKVQSMLQQHELYSMETESCNQIKSILHDNQILVDIISVRVPIPRCNSMAVFCELKKDIEIDEFEHVLQQNKEIVLVNDTKNSKFPMPYYLEETSKIYVGRVKKNKDYKNNYSFWVVSDSMRKSYLINAVNIILLMLT